MLSHLSSLNFTFKRDSHCKATENVDFLLLLHNFIYAKQEGKKATWKQNWILSHESFSCLSLKYAYIFAYIREKNSCEREEKDWKS